MALARRSGSRFEANIWPGFVDAMTALLLVLFFVLSIFMIVQFVLRDQVTEKDKELDSLAGQVAQLADALGLEQQRSDVLETEVGTLTSDLDAARTQATVQATLIASLTDQRDAAERRIASFEEQVAGLLAQNTDLSATIAQREQTLAATEEQLAALQDENARTISESEALNLALAQAREEIDATTEQARLAAARREALEAMVADLRARNTEQAETISARDLALLAAQSLSDEQKAALEALRAERERLAAENAAAAEELAAAEAERLRQVEQLSEAEAAKLAEAAAAEALRQRLANADTELTAMTLRLEEERRKAEETLTLLAAARAARDELAAQQEVALTDAEERAALLAAARAALAEQTEISTESQRQVELLNQQTAALNQQLRSLQALLNETRAREEAANVRIETLGSDLNIALAKVASEERARAELEEAERKRLEAEAKNLENYRSEFFGRVREILGDREGVRIVGDRFVFSSEVLFDRGSAFLGVQGRRQLAEVAAVIREVQAEIPEGINWILRVDGHTDNIPISGGTFADNWELSQARALSVVKYLITAQGIPANRLSANGFGEFQPIDDRNTDAARARNRRIELKFTER